jgi:phage-related protein
MTMEAWRVALYGTSAGVPVVLHEIVAAGPPNAARILRYLRLLEQQGLLLRGEYVRHVKGKLFELRPDAWQVLYFATEGHTFVALRCFRKKTQRTPDSEIHIAEARMADYLQRAEGS